ncbi:MAG: extracellular solute-binding protein [Lachnospiraceae bacterium]|nr:extracellular solute-binding protein [Lachnospiraceae bacterium]
MRVSERAKKVISLGMALILCLSMMTGCGSKSTSAALQKGEAATEQTEKTDGAKKAEKQTTETATPEPTAQTLSPGEQLAAEYTGFVETPMDLGGRTIKFLTTASSRYTYKENKDETSNETIEIIKAIESIEKDYNCKIEIEQLKAEEMVTALVTAKAAGDVYCDILEFGCSDTYLEQIYSANLVMPVDDPEIKDIIKFDTNPWLPASQFGRMFGEQYGVHFKTNNSGDLLRGVVLFNKQLADKYNLGNLYDMVNNKEWTFAKLDEMCASIASQSDGTVYPILYNQEGIILPMLIYANGGSCAEYTDSGYKFTALSDQTLEAINLAVDWKQKGYMHPSCEKRKEAEGIFANGEAVFFFTNYASLKKYTQGTIPMEDSVGLLPGPAGPSGDGNYNAVSYTEALFHVMNNVEKPDEVAAVLVALANRTAKRDMIETELMETLQDEESAQMLQLMYDNMNCDFSRSISLSRIPLSAANKEIMNLEKTPKEAYEELETTIQTVYDELTLEQ